MKKMMIAIMAMILAFPAIPASAASAGAAESGATLPETAVEASGSYGVMNPETGEFIYADPWVTLPDDILSAGSYLPSKYDLRNLGLVTGVKDQGDHEFCWAFSSIAAMESNLIKKGIARKTVDLSEAHLAYYALHGRSTSETSKYAGRDTCRSSGGETSNFFTAAATLARGYGPVNEGIMPYGVYRGGLSLKSFISEKIRTKSLYQLEEAIFFSMPETGTGRYNKATVNMVKTLIMKNGAMAAKMYFPDPEEWPAVFGGGNLSDLEAYYSTEKTSNHAVTLVGWDDSYNDFKSTPKPPGPGAWIVKNSYGSGIHSDGYFYASYYSPGINQFLSLSVGKNTGRMAYQYDGTGFGDGVVYMDRKTTGANTFKARSDVMIDQVMVFTPETNCKATVKIYVTKNGKDPASGTLLYNKTFKKAYSGFKRLKLGSRIGIPKGASFSITVTVKTPEGYYLLPFELQNVSDPYHSPETIRKGQSYVCIGGKWSEITKGTRVNAGGGVTYRPFNANVKGFGTKAGNGAQKIKAKKNYVVKRGRSLKLNARRIKGKGRLVYQSASPAIASVTAKGVVKARKKGRVKITIYALPTAKFKSAKKVVTVRVK